MDWNKSGFPSSDGTYWLLTQQICGQMPQKATLTDGQWCMGDHKFDIDPGFHVGWAPDSEFPPGYVDSDGANPFRVEKGVATPLGLGERPTLSEVLAANRNR